MDLAGLFPPEEMSDVDFFIYHPKRLYRSRRATLSESANIRSMIDERQPMAIVIRENFTLRVVALMGDPEAFPDDEKFLAAFWKLAQMRIETGNGGPITLIGPEEHAELLRSTGHSVEGAKQ